MCREEELPNSGDFLVRDIEICGASVIIIRGKDRRLRAFHNVCSHRGNRLVYEPSGSTALMLCPYHHWSYSGEGRLTGVPDEGSFGGDLDKAKCGLTPVAMEIWHGFVFINLQPKPEIGLSEFLGRLGIRLGDMPLPFPNDPITIQADLACNWKLAIDAFSEAYHVIAVHRNTIGPTFSSNDNRHAHLLDADFYGPHRSCSMYGNPDYAPAEDAIVEKIARSFLNTGNVITAASLDDVGEFLGHPSVNPTKRAEWAQDLYMFFPNMGLYTNPGGFITLHYWPTSISTTRLVVKQYLPSPTNRRERFQQELRMARVTDIFMEDIRNFARLQHGVGSGGKTHMILQDNEVLIRHAMHQIERWTSAPSVAQAMEAAA